MAEVTVCVCRIEHRHAEVTGQVHTIFVNRWDGLPEDRMVWIRTLHRSQWAER